MSDKKLLSENTVRRFMALANVGALSDNFIQESYEEEEEPLEEELEAEEETDLAPEEGEGEGEEEELEMDAELDAEEFPAEEPGAADVSLTEEEAQLLIDLGERLGAALGSAEPDVEEEEEPAMDMAPEEEEPAMDMAPEEEEEEAPVMQEGLVQEVLKRVTKRIISEKIKKNR